MNAEDKISAVAVATCSSLKSVAKIVLQSRRCSISPHSPEEGDSLVILANGPSLRTTLEQHAESLRTHPTLAVNFAANTPEFAAVRPSRYVLADPHFFSSAEPNVQKLWANINAAAWHITLYVPASEAPTARILAPSVRIETFNAVGIEGFSWFCHAAFSRGLGMPRPRNVLIPAIMIAIKAGFSSIYLTGADHSWLRTISVNDYNEVVSIQPHFYTDDKREQVRSAGEYKGYRLHDILNSFTVAFKSYHDIAKYALSKGIKIYNATPGSFIDAFPRKSL